MQTTAIAFSCNNWILSTPTVSNIVFMSCRTLLSTSFEMGKSSFNSAKILHSLCSTLETAPNCLLGAAFLVLAGVLLFLRPFLAELVPFSTV
ncbi:hypothetical protein M758_2G235600 [Ceratodon purpureus]|nr:hypothetical protein M758_4G230300 [Ceratodon purpureus]KAG0627888.1 hypothetical protein M758_2G235600 [Ceratodon purpureus]